MRFVLNQFIDCLFTYVVNNKGFYLFILSAIGVQCIP